MGNLGDHWFHRRLPDRVVDGGTVQGVEDVGATANPEWDLAEAEVIDLERTRKAEQMLRRAFGPMVEVDHPAVMSWRPPDGAA